MEKTTLRSDARAGSVERPLDGHVSHQDGPDEGTDTENSQKNIMYRIPCLFTGNDRKKQEQQGQEEENDRSHLAMGLPRRRGTRRVRRKPAPVLGPAFFYWFGAVSDF